MTTVSSPMQKLEQRLIRSGFPRAYIKVVTPDWWDKSLESSVQSMLMLKMHLAKHLGLELGSLISDKGNVQFQPAGSTHYKLTQSKSKDDVLVAQSLAESVAKLVASATETPFTPIPRDPQEIRAEILSTKEWVSLEGLVEYLWEHGVPVIHLKKMPAGAKKFDGMVVDVEGRPVIVLTRGNKAPAWQLFILAHETGHIGSGHVESGTVFFDEKVEGSGTDEKEIEATQYGLHLLTGSKNSDISGRRMKAIMLSQAALRFAKTNGVDPGHVVLNFGHTTNNMPLAQAALKNLPDQYRAPEYITSVLNQKLDLDLLPDDSKDILERLM